MAMERIQNEDEANLSLSTQDLRAPGRMAATLGYNAYSDILASTISTLDTPTNVGIFAGWGSGKSYLLNKIRDTLSETSRQYPTTKGNFFKCVWMLLRLIFFIPPQALRRSDEIRFIPAYFNALEYAGSDHLWAGLVTRLVYDVEWGIGLLPSAIFRAKPPRKMPLHCITSSRPRKLRFRPKTLCGSRIPLYSVFIVMLIVSASAGAALLIYALNKQHILMEKYITESNGTSTAMPDLNKKTAKSLALGSIIISIPVVAFLKDIVPVILKIVNSQAQQITKILSKPDFSKELGVMAKIKKEIKHLSKLVCFMELFEQRRIVVTIFIDELDKLPQQNIAPLLQAIKILLSDPSCRFVSIIAIDPYSVSAALEMGIQSQFPAINISGHKFLKQMIQVPFSIPTMNSKEKVQLFGMLEKRGRLSFIGDDESSPKLNSSRNKVDESKPKKNKQSLLCCVPSPKTDGDERVHIEDEVDAPVHQTMPPKDVKGLEKRIEERPLISPTSASTSRAPTEIEMQPVISGMVDKPLNKFNSVVTACDSVLAELSHGQIFPFIRNNFQEMQRLVGIVKVTTRVIFCRILEVRASNESDESLEILPRYLAAWVVLVGQWPYRTTWMIQQVEDRDDAGSPYDAFTALLSVYRDAETNFTLVAGWRKLIQLDGDPDDLESFLNAHSNWLNIRFLTKLLPHTISLDRSLKSIVAWTSVERDLKTHTTHASKPLSHMDVSDVINLIGSSCKGSKRLDEYGERCQQENINGIVLLRGDLGELKNCLHMSLGDWTLFSHSVLQLRTVHKFKFST